MSSGTGLRFYASRSAGGRRRHSVALVIDVSSSMQGARASCTEILLIALMAAFRECGIDHEPIILVSEHAVIAKTEKMPWDDATAAVIVQLLRNCNQAGSFEFEGILLAHQMLQQSDFRSKTSTVFVFSDGYTGNQRCATERLNYPRKQRVSFNGISMRSIFRFAQLVPRFAQSIASLNLASLRLECLCVPVINRFARITISF